MRNIQNQLLILLIILVAAGSVWSQASPNCATASDDDYLYGRSFFNFGSVTQSLNTKMRLNATVGQPVVGSYYGPGGQGTLGFWSSFLLPPAAPVVMASEGDLDDRVQIDWTPDPLSPAATTYKIYRNGSLLATVDGETFSFIDFNVLAGRFYTYEVSGVNTFGEGFRGSALGFLNPNGSVTGQVKTFSNNAVPGAIVKLEPTFGSAVSFNGNAMAFTEYSDVYPTDEFTLSCWVKLDGSNDGTAIFDFGSVSSQNWWLHTLPAASGKGVRFGVGKGSGQATTLEYIFPAATANDWHYVAASYNGSSVLLYVDGELIETAVTTIERGTVPLFLGQKGDGNGHYAGKLDELRFFNRQLPQTEIQMLMNQTASAETPGLVSYWKFDEGVGSKAFNIAVNKIKLYFCGAAWTSDKSPVVNAGVSNESGFYKIEGVNYGAGATFTARAYKNFYFNQSLEFNAANEDYADLTSFKLTDTASVTVTLKGFDFSGKQVILSQNDGTGNPFMLCLNSGVLELVINGTTESLGSLGMGFHHVAFTMTSDGSSVLVKVYLDGTFLSQKTFSATGWAQSEGAWKLGARADGSGHADYFTGLIDEVAFFKGALTLPNIQTYAGVGTNEANPDLRVYFNLNEGSGESMKDMGTELSGAGTLHGARWSTVAAITNILPHEFTPDSRFVSLNPSNTSADQVDFTDQSTIPVSGYVRFENTNCFQKKVEILVNGKSNVPQIYTDEDGKFSVDFEPGATVTLSPKYEDHAFYPPFWEIEDLSTPVSGILFRNQTKRTISGQMAGNPTCRKSVIPDGAIVKVKVATLNGCFEKILELENPNGKFKFTGIPPDSVTVAVIEHSNPVIYTFFQNKGGYTVDLRTQNDTVDFIYLAPPEVEMSPLTTNLCGLPMLGQTDPEQTTIKVYESYDGGRCYLDSAMLTINNDIADLSQFDTLMTGGLFKYKFKAGGPNIVSPYLKTLQVTAEAHDELATSTLSTVVLGKRPRQSTFASTSPSIPTMILRDPPGDASFAFMEKGSTSCQTWSYSASYGGGVETEVSLSLGADLTTSIGLGAEVELEIETTADFTFSTSSSYTNLTTQESETCMTTTQVISTGDNDLIVGSQMGVDVYMGGAINYIFGISDELLWDTTS
ncbi:MAG: LamG-like jellyroll fold domain-containing protein, partial [Bacteroidota bacterium]